MIAMNIISEFYAYNRWANQRILDTAKGLTHEQLLAPVGASFESVRDTLVHTMQVQHNWLQRFQAKNLPAPISPDSIPDLSEIRASWNRIDRETEAYITSLKDTDLVKVIEYINSRGVLCRYIQWQMMLHQVNHATQHRSEVAVMLTQFGHSPGSLDYLVYVDQGESKP
jgi:uncharacterized damage-inducible protein DinB